MLFTPLLIWLRTNPRNVWLIAGLVGVIALLLFVYMKGRHDAHARDEARQKIMIATAQKLDAKAVKTSAADLDKAAEIIIAKYKELEDVVANVPDTVPDAVAVATGCRELRQHGISVADLPACQPAGR